MNHSILNVIVGNLRFYGKELANYSDLMDLDFILLG